MFDRFKKKPEQQYYWSTPSAHILAQPQEQSGTVNETSPEAMTSLLMQCGVYATCISATAGSSVITYNYRLTNLNDFSKAKRAAEALSARLGKSVIFDKSPGADFSLSIERTERAVLHFKTALLTRPFDDLKSPTACILGADTQSRAIAIDISTMPHLLIAGATGSGKSVLLHSIINSMLFKGTPSDLNFMMIDVKQIELTRYNYLPHLVTPVITDAQNAVNYLGGVCKMMDERYQQMARDPNAQFPRLIVIIDELADLMLLSKATVENYIVRLAQKARAAGIHLIIATQSPRASVLTGLIRSNIPARIGLRTATALDSRICIEQNGCEKLLGKGDGFFIDPASGGQLARFQAPYISEQDIYAIWYYWVYNALVPANTPPQ